MTRLAHTIDQAGLDSRAALCRDMARSAGRLALAGYNRRDAAHIALKGPQDFLTETDGAVEAHLKARIAEMFPQDAFLGEESGGAIGNNVWVVDPIDGTANFARQIPHFCISIAFVADGEIELGAIYNPSLDEFYFARRGRGAEKNGQAIRVADTTDRNAACVELGWSKRVPLATYLAALADLLEQGANVRRGASGALGLAYVAEGRSDAYAELHMFPWDCLAGLLLVEEAGGVVAPFLSVDGLAQGGGVLAAAPGIAGVVSQATGIAMVPARIAERAVAV
jgi:myo-inositol-1(or 4)-monophosphatase